MMATLSDMSLEAAAAHYGISTRTLARWIAAGRVSATHVGGRVRVSVQNGPMADTLADSTPLVTDTADGLADVADTVADTSANLPAGGNIIALLEAEVAHLRAQLDARTQAEAELRRRLGMALQRLELPSGIGDATSPNRLPWWSPRRWWPWRH